MTTAREQARQAVYETVLAPEPARIAANTASDVWEPLLQKLVDGIDGMLEGRDPKIMSHNLQVAYNKAKEALGDE